MPNTKSPVYTDNNGSLASIAARLEIQSKFLLTVGGPKAEYQTNGTNDTEQLQRAFDTATANPSGGEIRIIAPLTLFNNAALTENLGSSSLKKSCVALKSNVFLTADPGATVTFNSGDPDTNLSIVKTGCFGNFGNLENFAILDVTFDGLSDSTGVDANEHSAVNLEGNSQGGCVVKNGYIRAFAKNTASSAFRLRSVGVRDITLDVRGENVDCIFQCTLGPERIFVENAIVNGTFAEGVLLAETTDVRFKNISAVNVAREGFRITDTFRKIGCSNITVGNVYVKNSGLDGSIAGVCIEGGKDIVIDKVFSEDNQRHGLFIGKPTVDARQVNNIVVSSGILKNNNQSLRTIPLAVDCGVRLFNTNDVTLQNVYAFDDQTATNVIPKLVITTNNYTIPKGDEYVRTFGNNSISSGSKTFVLPSPLLTPLNRHITIIDDKGTAAVDNITITSPGAVINGLSSAVINTNGGAITLRNNGNNWETAITTQYRGIFSNGGESGLKIIGGKSYGNLFPDIALDPNTNIWLHDGIPNRVVGNLNLSTILGSNGDSLQVFYQDTTNNKTAALVNNSGTGNALEVVQNGILAASRRAISLSINQNLVNAGSHGLYVSSTFAHTGTANSLATLLQTNAASTANMLRIDDAGVATSVTIQKTGALQAGASVGRFDIAGVMANADNSGINILSTQVHTGVGSSLLRLFNGNVASLARCINIENDGPSIAIAVQQDGNLAVNQRGISLILNGALTNTGSSGISVISLGVNTLATAPLLNVENNSATSVNRVGFIKDAGTGTALLISKLNQLGSGLRVETAGTTSFGSEIIASALTTGSASRIFSNSGDTSVRSLQIIENNNVLATETTPLELRNLAPSATGFRNVVSITGNGALVGRVGYGNGSNPNTVLTGTPGDLIMNGLGNQTFLCVGTAPSTTWVPITALQRFDVTLTTASGISDALTGRITTAVLTTAAGATQTFTIANNRVGVNDDVIVTFKSYGGTTGKPEIRGYTTSSGQFTFDVLNGGVAALDGLVVVSYIVVRRY